MKKKQTQGHGGNESAEVGKDARYAALFSSKSGLDFHNMVARRGRFVAWGVSSWWAHVIPVQSRTIRAVRLQQPSPAREGSLKSP